MKNNHYAALLANLRRYNIGETMTSTGMLLLAAGVLIRRFSIDKECLTGPKETLKELFDIVK